jgi:chromosome segregation ATPase
MMSAQGMKGEAEISAMVHPLVSSLSTLLDEIEAECRLRRHAKLRSAGSITLGWNRAVDNKKKLDSLLAEIAKAKFAVAKCRQESSFRTAEDQIVALKKKYSDLNDEREDLEEEGLRLESALAQENRKPIIDELREEISKQRQIHGELRRANTDVEQRLRTKQRICAQLEEQLHGIRNGSKTPHECEVQALKRQQQLEDEIQLFQEESDRLASELKELKQTLNVLY